MQKFEGYVKETNAKLSRKVEDLEDVRFVMSVLKEVCLFPASNAFSGPSGQSHVHAKRPLHPKETLMGELKNDEACLAGCD